MTHPKRGFPTAEQRKNCLRLAAKLEDVSQNFYTKVYRNDPIIFLLEEVTGQGWDCRDEWYDRAEKYDDEFDERLDELFYDAGFLFHDNPCVRRDAVTIRLHWIASLPEQPTTRWSRLCSWFDNKFLFLLQADP